jgi:hypothetical protein
MGTTGSRRACPTDQTHAPSLHAAGIEPLELARFAERDIRSCNDRASAEALRLSTGQLETCAARPRRRAPGDGRDPRLPGLHPDRRGLAARPRLGQQRPVFITHGRHDAMTEVGFPRRARSLLQAGGTAGLLPRVRRRPPHRPRRRSRPHPAAVVVLSEHTLPAAASADQVRVSSATDGRRNHRRS